MKVKGILSCRDLEILRGGIRAKRRITALNFKRADSDLFRNLLEIVPWDKVLEGRGI